MPGPHRPPIIVPHTPAPPPRHPAGATICTHRRPRTHRHGSITHSPPSPPHLLLHALGIEAVGHRIVNLRLHLDRQSAHEFRHLLPRRHSPRAAYTDVRSKEATSMPRPTSFPSFSVGLYHRHLIVSGRSNLAQDRPSRQALLQ